MGCPAPALCRWRLHGGQHGPARAQALVGRCADGRGQLRRRLQGGPAEMISERTRDKMSAARRKGKWVGGGLALGYGCAPQRRALVVNEGEARQVREMFK